MPIAPTYVDHTDLTIAVNLGGAAEYHQNKPTNVKMMRDISASPFKKQIHRFVTSLTKNKPKVHNNWDAYDVANHAIDAMQSQIARHRLAAAPPNVLIEMPRNACGTMEFSKANEMIELGYERTAIAMAKQLK